MTQQSREQQRSTIRATEQSGTDPLVIAAAASVLLSWYEYFGRGNKEMGLFVGLWPPTILAFASYFRQRKMLAQVESMMPTSIRETVNRMMGIQ